MGINCRQSDARARLVAGRYAVQRGLSAGAQGTALLCTDTANGGGSVVLKQVALHPAESGRGTAAGRSEAALLAALDHVNILRCLGCFEEDEHLYLVLEHCAGGDLAQWLAARKTAAQPLSEAEVLRQFCQVALALAHVHSQSIIHRDVKSSNVFLTGSGLLRLGDFGCSRSLQHTAELAQTVVGTPLYLAPEVCGGAAYGRSADVWGLGCLLYELCSLGQHPFSASNLPALLLKILAGRVPPLPAGFSPELRALLAAMLQQEPRARPSCREVLCLPFLKPHLAAYAQHVLRLTTHPAAVQAGQLGSNTAGSQEELSSTAGSSSSMDGSSSPAARHGRGLVGTAWLSEQQAALAKLQADMAAMLPSPPAPGQLQLVPAEQQQQQLQQQQQPGTPPTAPVARAPSSGHGKPRRTPMPARHAASPAEVVAAARQQRLAQREAWQQAQVQAATAAAAKRAARAAELEAAQQAKQAAQQAEAEAAAAAAAAHRHKLHAVQPRLDKARLAELGAAFAQRLAQQQQQQQQPAAAGGAEAPQVLLVPLDVQPEPGAAPGSRQQRARSSTSEAQRQPSSEPAAGVVAAGQARAPCQQRPCKQAVEAVGKPWRLPRRQRAPGSAPEVLVFAPTPAASAGAGWQQSAGSSRRSSSANSRSSSDSSSAGAAEHSGSPELHVLQQISGLLGPGLAGERPPSAGEQQAEPAAGEPGGEADALRKRLELALGGAERLRLACRCVDAMTTADAAANGDAADAGAGADDAGSGLSKPAAAPGEPAVQLRELLGSNLAALLDVHRLVLLSRQPV